MTLVVVVAVSTAASMPSFLDLPAPGCERVPLTAAACFLAEGAEASCLVGSLKFLMLSSSSDDGARMSRVRGVERLVKEEGRARVGYAYLWHVLALRTNSERKHIGKAKPLRA